MSIETLLLNLTAAVEANTAAVLGKAATGATTGATGEVKTKTTAAKDKPAAYVAKHTKAEAQAAVNQVKEEKGVPAAKALIKALGYDKLADITKAEDLDRAFEEASKIMGVGGEDAGGEDEGI